MTDDEIILAAERIKIKRLLLDRISSLDEAQGLMIRWSNPSKKRESYTSVRVPLRDIRPIVERILGELINEVARPDLLLEEIDMTVVVFNGSTDEQVRWGSNDDPREVLVVGDAYEVEKRDVRSWHTKIKVRGFYGWFNAASFSDAK